MSITGIIELKAANGASVQQHNTTIKTYGNILQKALAPTDNIKRSLNYMFIEFYNSSAPDQATLSIDPLLDPITSYYNLFGTSTYNDRDYLKVPIIMSNALNVSVSNVLYPGLTFLSKVAGNSVGTLTFNNTSVIYGGSLVSCASDGSDPIVWARSYLDTNNRLPAGSVNVDYQWTISFNTASNE